MFSSINVYFSHLTTNYEEPNNAINFKIIYSTINCHGSFKFFTIPRNHTTHLMINLLKKLKGKKNH